MNYAERENMISEENIGVVSNEIRFENAIGHVDFADDDDYTSTVIFKVDKIIKILYNIITKR